MVYSPQSNGLTWGTDNILWLPPNYRPDCVGVHGNFVAFGYDSGRVMVFEIAP
jgi:hypothetical protein